MLQAKGIDHFGVETIVELMAYKTLKANLPLQSMDSSNNPAIVDKRRLQGLGLLAELGIQDIRADREKISVWIYVIADVEQFYLQMVECHGFQRIPVRNSRDTLIAYFRVPSRTGTGEIFGKMTGVEGMPHNPGTVIFSPFPFGDNGKPTIPEELGLRESICTVLFAETKRWTQEGLFQAMRDGMRIKPLVATANLGTIHSDLMALGLIELDDKTGFYYCPIRAPKFREIFGVDPNDF